MGFLFAKLYDRVMRRTEAECVGAWRQELLAHARGRVVEIGAGTGANLGHYAHDRIEHLTLTEPDRHMRTRLSERLAQEHRTATTLESTPADDLGLPDASVDCVVTTLVLCSVPDIDAAVSEIQRVLRPGGRVLFVEHVAAAAGSRTLRWQRRLEPLWSWCAGGCRLTRRPLEAFAAAGLTIDAVEHDSMHTAPPWVRPVVRGIAVRA